jgi:hypothetical protein
MILKFFYSQKKEGQLVSLLKTKTGKKIVLPNYQIKDDSLYEVEVEEKETFFYVKRAEKYVPFLTFEDLGNGTVHLTSICGLNVFFDTTRPKDQIRQKIEDRFVKHEGLFKYSLTPEFVSLKINEFLHERKKTAKKGQEVEKIITLF